jgi:hypothetical protein|eukprot:4770952-Prymnesium_polylepis.3
MTSHNGAQVHDGSNEPCQSARVHVRISPVRTITLTGAPSVWLGHESNGSSGGRYSFLSLSDVSISGLMYLNTRLHLHLATLATLGFKILGRFLKHFCKSRIDENFFASATQKIFVSVEVL